MLVYRHKPHCAVNRSPIGHLADADCTCGIARRAQRKKGAVYVSPLARTEKLATVLRDELRNLRQCAIDEAVSGAMDETGVRQITARVRALLDAYENDLFQQPNLPLVG